MINEITVKEKKPDGTTRLSIRQFPTLSDAQRKYESLVSSLTDSRLAFHLQPLSVALFSNEPEETMFKFYSTKLFKELDNDQN